MNQPGDIAERLEALRLYEDYMILEESMSSDSTDGDFEKRDQAFAAYEELGLTLAIDEEGIVIRCAISGAMRSSRSFISSGVMARIPSWRH